MQPKLISVQLSVPKSISSYPSIAMQSENSICPPMFLIQRSSELKVPYTSDKLSETQGNPQRDANLDEVNKMNRILKNVPIAIIK